jgi:hypothetical protein
LNLFERIKVLLRNTIQLSLSLTVENASGNADDLDILDGISLIVHYADACFFKLEGAITLYPKKNGVRPHFNDDAIGHFSLKYRKAMST